MAPGRTEDLKEAPQAAPQIVREDREEEGERRRSNWEENYTGNVDLDFSF